MIRLAQALIRLSTDLRALRLKWAVIGGLAVSVRAEPRTTRDLDAVIAVAGDHKAERIMIQLRSRGYRDHPDGPLLEQKDVNRLAGIRLLAPGEQEGGLVVDLLFASSGVEPEIIAAADLLEVLPGVVTPVAKRGHLLALKVLAGRSKDLEDFQALLKHMTEADLQQARETLDLIERRGYHRGKNLQLELGRLLPG